MLELRGPKPVTNPLVEIGKHTRCFREPMPGAHTADALDVERLAYHLGPSLLGGGDALVDLVDLDIRKKATN